ncbi:MBOAT family protein [Cupriavidus sp. DL-D2]|uniref:MBOAT family O-acyltransferase n=1 Tax=Cupriavidus sp. DL-D2 TaxID=3144974 RepID=UPI003214C8CC
MLFTSLTFLFAYLPIVLVGYFVLGRFHRVAAAGWLAAASVFFYGYWSVKYVPLLLGSILFNYGIGYAISVRRDRSPWARRALIFGVIADLGLLAYYKYANFFLLQVINPLGGHAQALNIILPIGISFFTFTQIAFLVDVWKGKAREFNFVRYLLFVTWFPHLIAGPVLHHGQMMPQFADAKIYRIRSRNLVIGMVLFAIGLAKKLLIADPISAYADPVFEAAAAGDAIGALMAWTGALAYTFQIYFDFSGYSDMAVGLSMLFGVRLPINFNSPYKATNIIEFWRRWHMTLSQFLRDYLYIPLGGNQHGQARRYFNLLATMVLGGLWHGAAWTFVIWGAIHGALLCVNHGFRWAWMRLGIAGRTPRCIATAAGVAVTFLSVVVAWVYFRADTVAAANSVLLSMVSSTDSVEWTTVFRDKSAMSFAGYASLSFLIVWVFPNAYEAIDFVENRMTVGGEEGRRVGVMLTVGAATITVGLIAASLLSTFGTNVASPFLYFQF